MQSKAYNDLLQRMESTFTLSVDAEELNLSSSEDAIRRASMFEDYTSKKQDREQRKQFSIWIFGIVCVYLLIVLVLLYLTGFSLTILSDTVLVSLLTTTTANVIGLLVIVARYLFPRNGNGNKDMR